MSAADPANSQGDQTNPWLLWAKRLLTLGFFILIPTLLFFQLRNLDWQEVTQALRGYPATTLLLGVGISVASFITYCCFDLLGRIYTGHRLPIRQTMPVTFVCYAFTLNLSALVGGVALRYRLYSRLGLDVPTITRILSLSLITNWLGYIILAGLIFSLRLLKLPESWEIGVGGLQLIGFGLLLVAAGYLLACGLSKRRVWRWRGHEIILPPLRLALAQAGLGALNWSLMALLIFILLPEDAFYPTVLGILMISSIAGVITHIPAGLGVLEMVFITLLQHQFGTGELLAALIGYRALYFLLPLAVACIVYLVLEKRAKAMRSQTQAEPEQTMDSDQPARLGPQDQAR